jgi:hypothetical protein
LLKVGGIARHSIPLTGHREHGLVYPTIKFYTLIVGQNHYHLLRSDISIKQSELDFVDPRFRILNHDGSPLSASNIKLTDAWLVLVYRKTRAADFRVPFDHLDVDDPLGLGERLSGNFSAFSRMRLTESRRRDPIGDKFEWQAELRRRGIPLHYLASLIRRLIYMRRLK